MSETSKNEFASAFKWILVIVVAAIAYSMVAPNYFFMKHGNAFFRGNRVTGILVEIPEDELISGSDKKD